MRDENGVHRPVQVDLDLLANDGELLEDFYDILAIELCKQEGTTSWEEAKRN